MLLVMIWSLILACCLTASVTSEECERTDTRREFQVTCDSRQVSRSYCSPGQRVNDSCLEDPCVYCPEGQYQDMYTNCETCLNCTTKEDCCNGQVLTSDCKTNKNAECGCPACPEAMTPTCPTCPTVCNITNQTEAPDGTLTTPSSAADPDEVTTSSMTSSDANIVTNCPGGTEDTLLSKCECTVWKIAFFICIIVAVVSVVVTYLCTKRAYGNRENGNRIKGESKMLLESRDKAKLIEENRQLHIENAKLKERLKQQSKPLGNENQEATDATDASQRDRIASENTIQPSTPGRDRRSPSLESDAMKRSAESQKVHHRDSMQSATNTNRGEPSSANMKPHEIVSDEFLQNLHGHISPKEWKRLGWHLRLKDSDLENIESDKKGDHKQIVYEMLQIWKKKNGKSATYKWLGDALRLIGRKDLYDEMFTFDETPEDS